MNIENLNIDDDPINIEELIQSVNDVMARSKRAASEYIKLIIHSDDIQSSTISGSKKIGREAIDEISTGLKPSNDLNGILNDIGGPNGLIIAPLTEENISKLKSEFSELLEQNH